MAAHQADAARMLDDRGYTGHLIRGQPAPLLFEEAVRNRITQSYYWKEQCFALNAATLCDRAVELTYAGGTYHDGQRPTAFICLAFKMVLLDLSDEIVQCYLQEGGEEFKYLRALALFYIRLTARTSEDVYKGIEGYLEDYRKLRWRGNDGWRLSTIDQFVDDLLTKERVCATSFWKLVPREKLEDDDVLDPRVVPEEVQALLDEDSGRESDLEMVNGNGDRRRSSDESRERSERSESND